MIEAWAGFTGCLPLEISARLPRQILGDSDMAITFKLCFRLVNCWYMYVRLCIHIDTYFCVHMFPGLGSVARGKNNTIDISTYQYMHVVE